MQEFLNWTIDTIREDRLIGTWLEEKKFEWTPITSSIITNLLKHNKSILIIADEDRNWFLNYIMLDINKPEKGRPFLPFYDFDAFYKNISSLDLNNNINLLKDMLNISFPNGYVFWYIGHNNDKKANITKRFNDSYIWLLDEDFQNSFTLQSSDEALDFKLLQMYRLFEKTLNASLFAQIDVQK